MTSKKEVLAQIRAHVESREGLKTGKETLELEFQTVERYKFTTLEDLDNFVYSLKGRKIVGSVNLHISTSEEDK